MHHSEPAPIMGVNLAIALHKAQKSIAHVGKDARNDFGNYDYASSEHMIASCRAALLNHDLVLSASPSPRMIYEMPGSSDKDCVIASCGFVLVHVESGESAEFCYNIPAITGKGRPLDKAVLGAWTTTLSYFLRDLLLIPRQDENEINKRDDSLHATKTLGDRGKELVAILEEAGMPKSDLVERIRRRYPDISDDPAEWPASFERSILATINAVKSGSNGDKA